MFTHIESRDRLLRKLDRLHRIMCDNNLSCEELLLFKAILINLDGGMFDRMVMQSAAVEVFKRLNEKFVDCYVFKHLKDGFLSDVILLAEYLPN